MGARRGRSTGTALGLLTEQFRTAWAENPNTTASLLSLDIAGAYDNVSRDRLVHNMRIARLPHWIAEFSRSFVSKRTTRLLFDGQKTAVIDTETRIPQGSPLSTILFLFFAATLLRRLHQEKTTAGGFVDDTHVMAVGQTTEDSCHGLEEAHATCEEWAQTHGAAFAPARYTLVHFTNYKRAKLHASHLLSRPCSIKVGPG